jgi:UDP-2,3-diacylglucosamine pyrophosphatase LpxH
MQLSFDLISDLHLDDRNFDWAGIATSPICVVAGDVTEDRGILVDFLKHLSLCYQQVLYIDGNCEHKQHMSDIGLSYLDLKQKLSQIKNVQYLHDDVVVINGVAFLGTNGWWGFDFDPTCDIDQAVRWYQEVTMHSINPDQIMANSINDAAYLVNSVKKLQTHADIKQIVIVSHTVPISQLIEHDADLTGSYKFNVMGNKLLDAVRIVDTEFKISTWCFGHYHGSVDRIINNIRYVNNCQGRPGTQHWQYAYYPKQITVNS